MQPDPKNFVNSIAKAFAVLRAFDAKLPELTITEVANRAELDRGTSFRLVHTLCQLGYLAAVPHTRRFRLTLKCLEIGYTPLAQTDLKMLARPLLRELVPDVADAASLGMLDDTDVVYIERVEGGLERHNLNRRIGSRTGAYGAALGQAILAFLPREQHVAILSRSKRVKLSEKTLTDMDALLERMDLVRKQGYAISDGENAYGLRTVAAPILGIDGQPVAGVSLTILVERADIDSFRENAVPRLLSVTAELTRAVQLTFGSVVEAGR